MKTVYPNKVDTKDLYINELYTSKQGEGAMVGKPVIFVRFSKCNMSCYFCDTNYQPINKIYSNAMDLFNDIEEEYKSAFNKGDINKPAVLLTGGEPSIYHLESLLHLLKENGYWVGIETNGRNRLDNWRSYLDHITVSPKAPKGINQLTANELRLVTQKFVDIDFLKYIERAVEADYYFISPMADDNGNFNLQTAYTLLDEVRNSDCRTNWQLSIQTHKLAGIR